MRRSPSPVATSMPARPVATTVPGGAFVSASSGSVSQMRSTVSPRRHWATGQGLKARTRRSRSDAPSVQSMAASPFSSLRA